MSLSTIAASPLPLLGILCAHEHVCAHACAINKLSKKKKKEKYECTECFLQKKHRGKRKSDEPDYLKYERKKG